MKGGLCGQISSQSAWQTWCPLFLKKDIHPFAVSSTAANMASIAEQRAICDVLLGVSGGNS
jgi:hypothetical protein